MIKPWYLTAKFWNKAAGPMQVVACMVSGFRGDKDGIIIFGALAIGNYFCHWRK